MNWILNTHRCLKTHLDFKKILIDYKAHLDFKKILIDYPSPHIDGEIHTHIHYGY